MRKLSKNQHAQNSKNYITLYGKHVVISAIIAKRRKIHSLYLTKKVFLELQQQQQLVPILNDLNKMRVLYIVEKEKINTLYQKTLDSKQPQNHNHQDILLLCSTLKQPSEKEFTTYIADAHRLPSPLIILDHIADPQNLGAIFRSAAGFSVQAIIQQEKNTAPLSPTVCKVSAGATELIDNIRVTNIARIISFLQKQGYFVIGLEAGCQTNINQFSDQQPIALLFGSEKSGIRRLLREKCDQLCFIPINKQIDSFNISHSVSLALYTVTNYGINI